MLNKVVNNNLVKGVSFIIALIIVSAAFCNMAAMNYDSNPGNMASMAHTSGCNAPQQPQSCASFHLGLLEKFSHGFSNSSELSFLMVLFAFGTLLFIAYKLFADLQKYSNILKVRLRQLYNDTISIFQDTFGEWLLIFEKRDPSYAFAMA